MHARRGGFGIGIGVARHHLKHPIDHADMEVHMLIQAGAEPVDESYCADMQSCLICLGHLRRTGAEGLQGVNAASFIGASQFTGNWRHVSAWWPQ